MKHSDSQYIKGVDILMEDLREVCVYQKARELKQPMLWWKYMFYDHQLCYEEINDECSEKAHIYAKVQFNETKKCVDESFEKGTRDKADNRILAADALRWKEYGSAYWPSIVINSKTFRGDMTPDNVFGAICAGFKNPPPYCIDF